ncbi:MAG: thermonuclease family protein [Xanthobacteraceae bacterium]|nr:thermonuclease family protein [Xanthobacteraceae bacterium]
MQVSARAGCDLELQGEGHVVAVTGPRTLRLDDGRDVRLAGIEVPAISSDEATAVLTRAALDRDVTLHGRDDTPDRYGRQPAFVVVYGEEASLQETLIGRGAAITAAVEDKSCLATLRATEVLARNAPTGAWADPTFVKNAADPNKILSDIGHFALVEGIVLSARQSGQTLYLNFGRKWNQGFAVTISRGMMASFAAAEMPPAALANKRIRVRGWIEKRGGPRIEVSRPDQIELIGDNSAVAAGGN